jgi:class 3 adenylate cyclase/tetratricopeptide (TPR) repeat protein
VSETNTSPSSSTSRCENCGHANPSGAKFCLECGAPQALDCKKCQTKLPGDAKFCLECGNPVTASPTTTAEPASAAAPGRSPRDYTPQHLADKILTSKSAIEGERKQVTVLFVDVKGSMEFFEAFDPEVIHDVMDRYFQILADGVHRFEGTVNQYTGDGIMALFGAPISHEDHAQRACYAALHIQEALQSHTREVKRAHGVGFSTRMGINSGEVVVGKIGDDLRMDYTAQGHTVGLAARMEGLASPDTIYLAPKATALVSGYFDLEDHGEFAVKGVSEPVAVHELRATGKLRTRFDVSRARGLSRFVGRKADMQTLESALEQAKQGGGQVVGVVAQAGTGKSRLCFEFMEGCRAAGLRTLEATGVAHGKNIPLLPMMQLFKQYYDITEEDSDRTMREKITGRMLLIDEGFSEVLPLLFEFFGVPDPKRPAPNLDADAKQRQIFGVLRNLVRRGDSEGPIIALIEDLHWIDDSSEEFLGQWVNAVFGASALLVVNFRPEYHAEWMQKSWYHQLALSPLGPEAIRELLDDLLGADSSIEGLAEAIHARTGGNPFFTEEVVQTLIEAGHLEGSRGAYRLVTSVADLAVPATVQSVLSARIDRLVEREKQVLQTAAVIGKEFEEPLLDAALDLSERDLQQALAALRDAEFLYEKALYPVAEYAFKHPLTQEVAYRSQLAEKRRRIHVIVAGAIERADPEKVDQHAALLAHHCEQAGETLTAARWYSRAAEWVRRSDPTESLRQWRKVRELIEPLSSEETADLRSESCLQILNVGGWRLGLSDEEIQSLYSEGQALGEARRDTRYQARLTLAYAPAVGISQGDVAGYQHLARETAKLADASGDAELRSAARITLMYSYLRAGELEDAYRHVERTRELSHDDLGRGRETLGFSAMIFSYAMASWVRILQGRGIDQLSNMEQGIAIARREQEFENLCWMLGNHALFEFFTGSLGKAEIQCMDALEHSERIGTAFSTAFALRTLSLARINRENWAGAIEGFERGIRLIEEQRTAREAEPETRAWLALALVGAGETERAKESAEHALVIARERGAFLSLVDANYALARAANAAGDPDAADAFIASAAERVHEFGSRAWEPLLALERATSARIRGDTDSSEHALRDAMRVAEELGAAGLAERAADALKSLY